MTAKSDALIAKIVINRRKIPCFLAGRSTRALRWVTGLITETALWAVIFRAPLVRAFNRLYYSLRRNTFDSTYFLGKHVLKFPTDLWSYQEIIFEKRPDVIVETGVFLGGSTLFLSVMQRLAGGNGRVIAVDVTLEHADPDLSALDNLTLLEGDTSQNETFERVRQLIAEGETVMVILDSDHTTTHVSKEMALFSRLVTPGQYMIVEDGIVDRVYPPFCNRGPLAAIKHFLSTRPEFRRDPYRERFLLSQNPWGYLYRVREGESAPPRRGPLDNLRPLTFWFPFSPPPTGIPWLSKLYQNRRQPNNEGGKSP